MYLEGLFVINLSQPAIDKPNVIIIHPQGIEEIGRHCAGEPVAQEHRRRE
jgi:hypothetical protein